ncbi:MAG: DUF2203 domain-containing protein [Chloroflexi bacterium]|nr:DUF2203 domain-containing protein [Chloroflexota bacterium]
MPRTFTLEEARALLPALRELLEQAIAARGTLERAAEASRRLEQRARGNGHGDHDASTSFERDSQQATASFQAAVRDIAELGVELKALNAGLVDFPSLREGRVVYLCWKLDEPDLAFWHPFETGFAGRQPL